MEEDEAPCTSSFFSRRAQLIQKKTAEELQAASELMKEIEEENSKIKDIEEVVFPNPRTRAKLRRKVKTHSSKDINGITSDPDSLPEAMLSAASKKRLKKFREEQELELERIEAENEKIFSAMDVNPNYSTESAKETAEDFEKITVLTIMYISKILRLKCYENDKFVDIFPKVAELFNLKVTEFMLCIKERNITVDDSPKSLNITSQDVLECIPYKVNQNSQTGVEDNSNTLKITFQSSDTKLKTDMIVHKIEKMQDIMERYSKQRNIPLDELIFDFDGERLSGDETPVGLDMEPGNCIDVTILVPAVKTPTKQSGRRKRR